MKKLIFPLVAATMLLSGCSDIFEKQFDIYEEATEKLEDAKTLPDLLDMAIQTEKDIASTIASATEEVWNELKEDYKSDYELMLDSVDAVRNRYFSDVDKIYNSHIMHFVEKRTILYSKVSEAFNSAKCTEEVSALNDFLKNYSAKAYIYGQRACDPPQEITSKYKSAKSQAKQNYEEALVRLGK